MAKRYHLDTRLEARRLYVREGKSEVDIAKNFDNKPNATTVRNWIKEKNPEGKSWEDERREYENDQYEKISPKNIASKILKRIEHILDKEKFNNKDADALAKLQKTLSQLVETKYQIPAMYQMLTDFMIYLKSQSEYQKLITAELIEAVKDFRTEIRKKLE